MYIYVNTTFEIAEKILKLIQQDTIKREGEFLIDLKVNKKNYIWVYFIAFFALWCIRELWLDILVQFAESAAAKVRKCT